MAVVSADSLHLAHVEMLDANTLPGTLNFQVWRTTGESLAFNPNSSDSTELGGSGRSQKPANVTGMSIAGDINFELSKFTALEEAISGVLAEDWGECPVTGTTGGAIDGPNRVTVGEDGRFFLIEKRFPNPDYVPGAVQSATIDDTTPNAPVVQITGGPAVGSGAVVVTLVIDGGQPVTVDTMFTAGATDEAVATALAAEINEVDNVSASASLGDVTITHTSAGTVTATVRAGNDQYFYQRYQGASYSVLNISASPNNPVTGSVSIVGGVPTLDKLPLAGANYVPAGNSAVFTAPEVMELSIGAALGVSTHCWTQVGITLDSQNRGIPCVGTQGDREVVLGTLTAAVTGDVYFSDDSVLDALLNNETIGDGVITFANADGSMYRFDFPGLKPTSGSLSAGGTGQDLTMPMNLQPTPKTVCDNAGTPWEAGVIISRDLNTAPPWPA